MLQLHLYLFTIFIMKMVTVQRQDTEGGNTRCTTTLSVTDNQPIGQSVDKL